MWDMLLPYRYFYYTSNLAPSTCGYLVFKLRQKKTALSGFLILFPCFKSPSILLPCPYPYLAAAACAAGLGIVVLEVCIDAATASASSR